MDSLKPKQKFGFSKLSYFIVQNFDIPVSDPVPHSSVDSSHPTLVWEPWRDPSWTYTTVQSKALQAGTLNGRKKDVMCWEDDLPFGELRSSKCPEPRRNGTHIVLGRKTYIHPILRSNPRPNLIHLIVCPQLYLLSRLSFFILRPSRTFSNRLGLQERSDELITLWYSVTEWNRTFKS